MGLLHYSKKPIERFDKTRRYSNCGPGKPPGFWVSVEGEMDWREWCESECPEMLGVHPYEVTLKPGANVLVIDSLDAIDDFHALHYGTEGYFGEIRWVDVMQAHDGILIAPYQWSRRMEREFMWYYSWDCASGVIWNLRAVEGVTEWNSSSLATYAATR